jgi:hypothetical protein
MKAVTALACLLYGLMAASLLVLDWHALTFLPVLVACLLAILCADFASGVLHIYLDYLPFRAGAGIERVYFHVGPRDTPEYLAFKASIFRHCSRVDLLSYNFKIHHWKPKAFTRKDYAFHALETMPAAFPVLLASFFLPPTWALGAVVMAFFVTNTQFIHACIHDTDRSVFWKKTVRVLQRMRVIYSFETHMEHHRHGQKNFCLITGWANPLLNPLAAQLFRRGVFKKELWDSLKQPERPPPV